MSYISKDGKIITLDGKPIVIPSEEFDALLAGKQDTITDLETIRSGAAAGATALQTVPDTYRTAEEQDAIHDSTKQDTISDLSTIRSGAAAGATALQSVPSTYRTAAAQDAIHDSTKQDTISDLSTIRSGAKAGATALQSVPSTYRTAAAQDAIHDSTKQDTISDLSTIRSGAKAGATALQGITTSSVIVTANTSGYVTITAPSVSGYTFVCWIGVQSNGFVGTPYISGISSSSASIFDAGHPTSTSSDYTYQAFALYKK